MGVQSVGVPGFTGIRSAKFTAMAELSMVRVHVMINITGKYSEMNIAYGKKFLF